MAGSITCWNCRGAVAEGTDECPYCYAGLDPAARNLSPDRAAEEQQSLVATERTVVPPPDQLGCVTIAGLILAGLITGLVLAGLVGGAVDSQPCAEAVSDCGEYGGIFAGLWAFLLGTPIASAVYIGMANRSLRKQQEKSTAGGSGADVE